MLDNRCFHTRYMQICCLVGGYIHKPHSSATASPEDFRVGLVDWRSPGPCNCDASSCTREGPVRIDVELTLSRPVSRPGEGRVSENRSAPDRLGLRHPVSNVGSC